MCMPFPWARLSSMFPICKHKCLHSQTIKSIKSVSPSLPSPTTRESQLGVPNFLGSEISGKSCSVPNSTSRRWGVQHWVRSWRWIRGLGCGWMWVIRSVDDASIREVLRIRVAAVDFFTSLHFSSYVDFSECLALDNFRSSCLGASWCSTSRLGSQRAAIDTVSKCRYIFIHDPLFCSSIYLLNYLNYPIVVLFLEIGGVIRSSYKVNGTRCVF